MSGSLNVCCGLMLSKNPVVIGEQATIESTRGVS
jgi:hypothetical protein